MRNGQGRTSGGLATALAAQADHEASRPADRDTTRALLRRGVDTVESCLLSSKPPASTRQPLPQLSRDLLEELRATTARLVDLDRRSGAPRVVTDADRHARSLAALLASTPENDRLRPRLLLATGESALLNAQLAFDQDEQVAGERWARLSTALAHLAGVADLAAAAVALHARILLDHGDHSTALRVLHQLEVVRPSARAQGYAHVWEAIAHAHAGRPYECMAALERAQAGLERGAGQPPTWWIPYTSVTGMVCGEAISALHLGKAERAYHAIEGIRSTWPTTLYRNSGDMLADLARATLEIGEAALACEHATASLQVAGSTGSRRQLRKLSRFAQRLESMAAPAAAEFRAQFALAAAPS